MHPAIQMLAKKGGMHVIIQSREKVSICGIGKSVRTEPNMQADDQYQDDAQPNGRHSDDKESGGYTNNVQELTIEGTTETANVSLICHTWPDLLLLDHTG